MSHSGGPPPGAGPGPARRGRRGEIIVSASSGVASRLKILPSVILSDRPAVIKDRVGRNSGNDFGTSRSRPGRRVLR
eukprot:167500-Hanusia_phi.AAC.1